MWFALKIAKKVSWTLSKNHMNRFSQFPSGKSFATRGVDPPSQMLSTVDIFNRHENFIGKVIANIISRRIHYVLHVASKESTSGSWKLGGPQYHYFCCTKWLVPLGKLKFTPLRLFDIAFLKLQQTEKVNQLLEVYNLADSPL